MSDVDGLRELWVLECEMEDGTWGIMWPTQFRAPPKPGDKPPAPGYRLTRYAPVEVEPESKKPLDLRTLKYEVVMSYKDKNGKTVELRGGGSATVKKR